MTDPLVTIITAAFDAEPYLDDAVRSVLLQDYPHWELLIVNDGSTDATREIALRHEDERITLLEQDNLGVSAARNAGLRRMKGEYYCFLDADDALTRASLSSRLRVFENNEGTCFVDGRVLVKDRELETVLREHVPSFEGNPLEQLLALNPACFFGPSWMFARRDTPELFFNEELTHGEDLLFFIEHAVHGGALRYTDSVILHYRSGNASAMTKLSGLESGYLSIVDEISKIPSLPDTAIEAFSRRARRIMFRSFLANREPIAALATLFRWDRRRAATS